MPPCWRVLTRVEGVIANYSYMEATVAIRRGQEILAEEPLAPLPVSLSDLHDNTRFLVPNVPHNGLGAVTNMYNDLSPQKQNQLNQLYNAQPAHGLLTQVATNAFLGEEKIQGHNFKVLRVYDTISRVNHSCRPNAALAKDPARTMGTLRALRDIAQGEDIFINYRADEQFTFANRAIRRQELQQAYQFTCQCPVCSLTGNALRLDRDARGDARQRFDQVSPAYPVFIDDQQKNTHLIQRSRGATEYVRRLRDLQIADGKVAELHIDIWTLLATLQVTGNHSIHCRGNLQGCRVAHMTAAQTALMKKLTIHIGLYGTEHKGIKDDEQHIRDIAELALES